MFLSRIWFILIALLAGVAVTMALVAPRPVVQKLALLEGQRLDRAQYAAEQMLKVDAHKWIDRIAKLGRDAIISESLDSASRGVGESTVIHRTVQDRLKTLIPDLAGGGIETIVAVDSKGRVVARVGDNDKEYGDFVGGAEVVADALRGYLSDDVWGTGGKLRRIAAGPVLSKSRDRIVGGLYVGAETGSALVDRLKKNLDVDVVLLLRGKIIASTKYATELASLSDLIDQHSKQMEELKRTPAISVTAGADNLLVVAAPFPGQAGQQKAYYALVGMQPAKSDVASLLSNTSSDDLKWGHFPWIPLAGGVFAMIAVGLFLQRLEVETPVRNLRRELQQLARGEIHKIQDGHYGGRFGGLARDVNAAMERFTHAPGPQSETATKDLNAILGAGAGQSFDLPSADSSFHGNTPPPAFGPPAATTFVPPPPPSFAPPPPPVFAPPPPFSAAAVQNASASPSSLHLPRPPLPGWGPTTPSSSDDADTRVVDLGENGTNDRGSEEELHFKSVFEDFLATKRKCGESIAGLTLDKFKIKLRENKAALMSKHHCRTVRFSVYIKDGKTALKATPVRD
ncbi:MAG TPA: MXAN_5187 family protein [Polyangia bacterium]|nr:MXAN_5187 family protein [Polyangia bacterium]